MLSMAWSLFWLLAGIVGAFVLGKMALRRVA